MSRLTRVIGDAAGAGLDIITEIEREHVAFSAGRPLGDDTALLSISWD